MADTSIKKKVSKSLSYIKNRNPYEIEREDDGLKIKKAEKGFNPKKEEGKVFLALIDGQDSTVKEVKKDGDDMVLEYEDKTCAITSKPLLIDGNQLYFSKYGFLGTIAINKETLMGGDVFQASAEAVERKISKGIDFSRLSFNVKDLAHDEDEDYYYIENDEIGDIAALQGSKQTLKKVNKAKRLRKLLQPSKTDRKKLLMAVGSGIAIGFYLYPQIQG